MTAQPHRNFDDQEIEDYNLAEDMPWLADIRQRNSEAVQGMTAQEKATYYREWAAQVRTQSLEIAQSVETTSDSFPTDD
jgi:mevalonate pyrophosphate decarboxylase